jgi:hypothetical protein
MIAGVPRTTSSGQRTEEKNRLFQSRRNRCEALWHSGRITTAVTIFRWRDDAARQAANSLHPRGGRANGTGSSRLDGRQRRGL